MAGPAVPGRWLERVGNGAPRQMTVNDRTRLTDSLDEKGAADAAPFSFCRKDVGIQRIEWDHPD